MTFKRLFSAISIFLISVCMLSAYSDSEYLGSIDPDSRKRRDDDYIGVIIKTNVDEAEVYVNGRSFGETPVTTLDLSDTSYELEIRKSGYDTIRCRIHPRKHYTSTYVFVMQKTCGYISLRGVPSGAVAYIDGVKESSFPMEVAPGTHTVKVRKFGYEDFSRQVNVENHKSVQVDVSLKVAPFSISQFNVSKTVINPDYSSSLGKTKISFQVTNDGNATVMVNDRYGNTVWSYYFASFSTWEQGVTWDGRGSDGDILPDGQYTLRLMSYDYDFSERIVIDRSMVYPLAAATPYGSGIGTMPCVFGNTVDYAKLYFDFGAAINPVAEKNPLLFVPIKGGLVLDFAEHVEIAGSIGTDIATDGSGAALKGGGSVKGYGGIKTGASTSLNFAGFVSYNYSAVETLFDGYDNGKGLALGGCMSLDAEEGFVGLTGQYSFGIKNKFGVKSSDVIKYGLVISFLPVTNIRTSLWGAMHNNKYLEAGAELITMPGSSGFCFDAKAWFVKNVVATGDNNKNMLINAQIGLSYLF